MMDNTTLLIVDDVNSVPKIKDNIVEIRTCRTCNTENIFRCIDSRLSVTSIFLDVLISISTQLVSSD